MTSSDGLAAVRTLFAQLRRRGFDLGPGDLAALRSAMRAGFGWTSRDALRDLLIALWSKTPREAHVLRSLFERQKWPDGWAALEPTVAGTALADVPIKAALDLPPQALVGQLSEKSLAHTAEAAPNNEIEFVKTAAGLPPWPLQDVHFADAALIDVEMYPLSHREVAQAFRRLRKPAKVGPPIEFDLTATVTQRLRSGVVTPPVLVPRRRNTANLVVFVDAQPSMRPYAPFVDMVCDAVLQAGLLRRAMRFYFSEIPSSDAGHAALDDLPVGGFAPVLDTVLARIPPANEGEIYLDRSFEHPLAWSELLQSFEPGTAALVISDADAARGNFDLVRLHDMLAFTRALRRRGAMPAWLNPVPRALWARSSAAQLARHVPMYALDRAEILLAVNALRGQPMTLEKPL